MCFNEKKSEEQLEWFDLIGYMAHQQRNLIFSPFFVLKNHLLLAKMGQKF